MTLRGPVLAAVTLDERAHEVLRQAGDLAAAVGAPLLVCHALPERVHMWRRAQHEGDELATLEARTRAILADCVHSVLNAGPPALEIAIAVGPPHAVILDQVERVQAGLLVVGPGRTGYRVVRGVPCPVLVARPNKEGCVIGATDFSDPSLPALDVAASEATRRHARLRLVHCLEFAEPVSLGSPILGMLPELPATVIRDLERSAYDRLRAFLDERHLRGDALLVRGDPAHTIVNLAASNPAELVVIGIRGRTNLSRLFLGSVAEAILHTAPCSVLVVHLVTVADALT